MSDSVDAFQTLLYLHTASCIGRGGKTAAHSFLWQQTSFIFTNKISNMTRYEASQVSEHLVVKK